MLVDEFKFNDEFFLHEQDREQLKKRFQNVCFAFYCEEASMLFDKIDSDSKAAKINFQRFGLGCVGLAVLSLLVAAADPIFIMPATEVGILPDILPKAVAGLAAGAGLLSVLIGVLGFGMGARKREWQKKRLMGERLRQWQGQYICSHIPEIIKAAGSDVHINDYIRERAKDFYIFKADHIDNVGSRLQEISVEHTSLFDSKKSDLGFKLWTAVELERAANRPLNETFTKQAEEDHGLILAELFNAYDAIRFRSQEDYTKYMLGDGDVKTHPRVQKEWLNKLGDSVIVLIVALHIIVIWGVLGDVPPLKSPIIHFLAVSIALIGLGIRVLEDGLQSTSHVTCLQDYLEIVCQVRRRFRKGETANAKRLEMCALEEAAARELLSFMRIIDSSRYVL